MHITEETKSLQGVMQYGSLYLQHSHLFFDFYVIGGKMLLGKNHIGKNYRDKNHKGKSDTFKLEFVSNIKDAYEFEKILNEAETKTLDFKPGVMDVNSLCSNYSSSKDITAKDISSKDISANERGAGMVEYALLVTLMSIGCMGAVSLMRVGVRDAFRDVADGLACTGIYDSDTNVCTPN